MAWADIPAKIAAYDAEEYADNSNGTAASTKVIVKWTFGRSVDYTQINVVYRDDFEDDLDYRMRAVVNLRKSRAIDPKLLNGDIRK